MTTLYEFRKDKPKPGDIVNYVGNLDENGVECRGATFKRKVEVVSHPIKPNKPNSPVLYLVRCTVGDPMTAAYTTLDALNPCQG